MGRNHPHVCCPAPYRASGRTGARVAFSGALAIGLLTSAPTTDARAATAGTATATTHQRPRKAQAPQGRGRPGRQGDAIAAAQKGDPYSVRRRRPEPLRLLGADLYSFRRAGFHGIPRTSSAQAGWARHVRAGDLRRGDLVFFTSGGHVYHVGVFAGRKNGHPQVLHSPYSGTRVRTERIWTSSWFGGTVRGR